MRIAIDAFGGDNAPLAIIKGAELAKNEYGIDIVLCGDKEVIDKTASDNGIDIGGFDIINAPDVIPVDEQPTELLKKYANSSMSVGLKALAKNECDAFISAGNSGALCVGATMIVKRMKGIKRPAFAPVLPNSNKGFMLLDGGANLSVRADVLQQYGILGSIYMEKVMGFENPRVALANVGSEKHKGGDLQHEAFSLLEKANINFIGNLESRDIATGGCDVYVCEGFTGNLVLKAYEGMGSFVAHRVSDIFKKNIKNKIAAGLVYSDLMNMKKELDANEYGGAPILGVSKPVFKAHGSSNEVTIKNAFRITIDYINANVTEEIQKVLLELKGEK